MREKAPKIVVVAALLLLAVPGAFALKPAARKPVAASRIPVKAKTVAEKSPVKASKSNSTKHLQAEHKANKSEPKVIARREKPAPIVRREESAPTHSEEQDTDSIHVTHDRKQHFSAEPHKATSADFTSSFAADRGKDVEPAKRKAPSAETKPSPQVVEHAEVTSTASPVLYNKRGRLIMPPAMKGSHEILLRQNEIADHEGLDRVQDDADLDQMREGKLLVAIPTGPGLQTDERLPGNRRYCRPWTAQFLMALARAHYAKFHTALQVNSAVRTVEFQQKLLMTNGNAAPAEGETASPHLTGQAVDLAKHGLSLTEIAWLRGYLLPLVQAGKVDVEEEFQQACFHISVYRKYVPEPAPKREIAGTHPGAGTTLATAIR